MKAIVKFLSPLELEAKAPNQPLVITFGQASNGKSAYQSAVNGGFTGTEEEFNTELASIGDIGAVLDQINRKVV